MYDARTMTLIRDRISGDPSYNPGMTDAEVTRWVSPSLVTVWLLEQARDRHAASYAPVAAALTEKLMGLYQAAQQAEIRFLPPRAQPPEIPGHPQPAGPGLG